MNDVSCILVDTTYTSDNMGVQTATEVLIEIPIIRVEDVRKDEFYRASQQGIKPSLRLRVSTLNYNDEQELIYMDKRYSIVRVDGQSTDETILICERKMGNG